MPKTIGKWSSKIALYSYDCLGINKYQWKLKYRKNLTAPRRFDIVRAKDICRQLLHMGHWLKHHPTRRTLFQRTTLIFPQVGGLALCLIGRVLDFQSSSHIPIPVCQQISKCSQWQECTVQVMFLSFCSTQMTSAWHPSALAISSNGPTCQLHAFSITMSKSGHMYRVWRPNETN